MAEELWECEVDSPSSSPLRCSVCSMYCSFPLTSKSLSPPVLTHIGPTVDAQLFPAYKKSDLDSFIGQYCQSASTLVGCKTSGQQLAKPTNSRLRRRRIFEQSLVSLASIKKTKTFCCCCFYSTIFVLWHGSMCRFVSYRILCFGS